MRNEARETRLKLSEQASAHLQDEVLATNLDYLNKSRNARKRLAYWIGFMEGALASRRIENGEAEALLAEADRFVSFFNDPDAVDLAEDLRARCFTSQADLMDQLRDIVDEKRAQLEAAEATDMQVEADEMSEFLGFCAGIICDGQVLQPEAEAILHRFRCSSALRESVAFQKLHRVLEVALADHSLDETEGEEVREWLARLVGDGYADTGLPNLGAVELLDDPITNPSEIKLAGSHFTLTGPMRMGPRSYIVSEIERVGGIYEGTTNRRTDYVVVSAEASRHWRATHFGGKILKAQDLIREGYKMRFVSETALERAIEMVGPAN